MAQNLRIKMMYILCYIYYHAAHFSFKHLSPPTKATSVYHISSQA